MRVQVMVSSALLLLILLSGERHSRSVKTFNAC